MMVWVFVVDTNVSFKCVCSEHTVINKQRFKDFARCQFHCIVYIVGCTTRTVESMILDINSVAVILTTFFNQVISALI